jgi:cysteine desulfurase
MTTIHHLAWGRMIGDMKPIYLDYQASTPLDERVLARMLPLFTEQFGNPHSAQHSYGTDAAAEVEVARKQVATLIGARASEVFFTSGATEANNTAILGVGRANKSARRRIVISNIEHPCVQASAAQLAAEGFDVQHAPVDRDGLIDLDALSTLLTPNTLLVSIMLANNEVGTLAPMAEISKLAHATGAWVHTDAAQAVGKVPVDVEAMGIDLLSLTGHKFYGPKGAGALFVRNDPRLEMAPLIVGGGQERGVRSGTVAVPLAAGLGEACAIATAGLTLEADQLQRLRDNMLQALRASVPGLELVGHSTKRLPGNLNVCIPGVTAERLLLDMPGLALSSASACSAGGGVPSHVLSALSLAPEQAECCFRIGIGRFTTQDEIQIAVETIARAASGLRAPLTVSLT